MKARVTITLDEDLLARIDEERGIVKRSSFIERDLLDRYPPVGGQASTTRSGLLRSTVRAGGQGSTGRASSAVKRAVTPIPKGGKK